jgi:hypothetical protein
MFYLMTFTPPEKTVDPSKLLIAHDILEGANKLLADLKTYRKEQYELFWYDEGSLRSYAEINDILIEMDAAEVGQSGKFFASAVELVQLILAIDPGSLENYEWYPKYDYTTDANGQIRMIDPDAGGGE